MSKKIPERSEIAVENTWRLEDLYGSDELWQADLVKFQQQIDALTGFAGKISQSAADLLAYMKLRDEISILADRLGNYAMRRSGHPQFALSGHGRPVHDRLRRGR